MPSMSRKALLAAVALALVSCIFWTPLLLWLGACR